MKLSYIKRMLVEDFPSESAWIEKLLGPFNQFVENITALMSKGLTVNDNMDGEVKEITFLGSTSVSFKVSCRNRPRGLIVSRFETLTGVKPTSAVQPDWSFNSADSTITVNSWYGGLTATSKYRVTFYVHTN